MLFLSQLANALVIGTLYALMSLGLSLIFGVLKLVNFSHGECLMVGGYLYYLLATTLKLPLPLALTLSLPALFLFGVFLEGSLPARTREGLPRARSGHRLRLPGRGAEPAM